MLVQLTALLALGVLCSSAPTSTLPHCSAVNSTIAEVLSDVENNRVTIAAFSAVPVDVKNKTCMHYNLEIFRKSLAENQENKNAHHQLDRIYKCEHLFPTVSSPQVPGNYCETARVSNEIFMQEFENFLRYLYEEL